MLRRMLLVLVTGCILTAMLVTRPWQQLPPAWLPWEPLTVDQSITPVTRIKLARLGSSPDTCLAVLAAAPADFVDYLALQDYTPVENCPLSNVVRVQSTGVQFSSAFTVTCPLLVRWLMFEHQQLQPLALEHLGAPVSRVEHFGSFACRNVYHRAQGRRSQHATASAFDVAAFRFENGSTANVLNDWDNPQRPEASAFLRELHSSACRYFGTVLGPDYNEPHANHFHLDTSGFNLCR